jgi:phosphoribosylanthranilate isomerase
MDKPEVRPLIQIYAFTRLEQVQEAVDMGVNHVGFIAGDYGLVYGELSFKQSRQIVNLIRSIRPVVGATLHSHLEPTFSTIGSPTLVRSLALTMATEVDEILRMVDAVQPDIVHISTDLHDVGLGKMELLRRHLTEAAGENPRVQIMKAIPVEGEESISSAQEFAVFSDYLLLDTKVRDMPGVGATGRTHDWQISRRIVESVSIPVILAGGLSPENVVEAIRVVGPAGVDSNTATNLPGDPVEKDMCRMRQFIDAARRWQENIPASM